MMQVSDVGYQAWLIHRTLRSTIQPAFWFQAGATAQQIDEWFTAPTALAYLGLRKEGERYVRN